VTWNDYAESHYIGDINPKVDLGDLAPQYVTGFIHAPWRIVAQHFIEWYKTGAEPAVTVSQALRHSEIPTDNSKFGE
jgi:glucan endo-1,3-alpha-glucosidase